MEIGDKVRLKKESDFYYQAPEQIGTITRFKEEPSDWCYVSFPNGTTDYRYQGEHSDLELVTKEETPPQTEWKKIKGEGGEHWRILNFDFIKWNSSPHCWALYHKGTPKNPETRLIQLPHETPTEDALIEAFTFIKEQLPNAERVGIWE